MAKEIYFLCAQGVHGGPEAIHQIVDKINNCTDCKAFVAFYQKNFVPEEKFKNFNVKYINIKNVPDTEDIVLCTPETHTHYLRKFKNVRKVIVWLSLYYYLRNVKEEAYTFSERCKYRYSKGRFPWPAYPLYYLKDLLNKKDHFKFDMDGILHTQNCEYVAEYLRENGVKSSDMIYLDGPVRAEYFENSERPEKKNQIAYNPGKGADEYMPSVIEEIKRNCPGAAFVPIREMTVAQVKETLLTSKVYLDFGFFPGPEKLVKEAALCGCNIITSDKGAAKNSKDILIPSDFKFNMDSHPYKEISALTKAMLENYGEYNRLFEPYVKKVKKLNDNFERDVIAFVDKINGIQYE